MLLLTHQLICLEEYLFQPILCGAIHVVQEDEKLLKKNVQTNWSKLSCQLSDLTLDVLQYQVDRIMTLNTYSTWRLQIIMQVEIYNYTFMYSPDCYFNLMQRSCFSIFWGSNKELLHCLRNHSLQTIIWKKNEF